MEERIFFFTPDKNSRTARNFYLKFVALQQNLINFLLHSSLKSEIFGLIKFHFPSDALLEAYEFQILFDFLNLFAFIYLFIFLFHSLYY